MSARRGHSLIEVLLACGLVALLFQLFAMVLVPLAKAAARSADEVELRNMATSALEKLVGDLDRGAAESISLRAAPLLVAVHPLAGLTADGRAAWDTEVVVYAHRDGRLLRRVWPPEPPVLGWTPGPSRPSRFKPAELVLLADGPSTTVAAWVKSCQVSLTDSLVRASLEVEREPHRYALSLTRALRNR